MKKGFTLIELLAVILILGIIALIAIPTVNNIINESKIGAFERTVDNLVQAIEQNCEIERLRGSSITNSYILTDGVISPTVEIKGKLPDSGTINVDNECNISFNNLMKDNLTASKQIDSNVIIVSLVGESRNLEVCDKTDGTCSNGIVYLNPVTGNTCTKAESDANVNAYGTPTEIKTGCMKWYVYKDNGNGTYQLILDHNTTSLVAWNSTGSNATGMTTAQAELDKLVNELGWTFTPDLIDAQDIADFVGASNQDAINWDKSKPLSESGWFYFDGSGTTIEQWQTPVLTGSLKSNYAWLYDNVAYCGGCNNIDNNSYNIVGSDSTAVSYGYWTKSAITNYSNGAWIVYNNARLYDNYVGNNHGIRPVITY